MSIGDVIRRQRLALELTQEQLGDLMFHTGHCICFWEKNRSSPSPIEIPRLCKSLNITPNDLFEWEEKPKTDEDLLNDIYMLIARRRGK